MNQPETPTQASIDLLKQKPELAPQFDARFGAGSSATILKADPNTPAPAEVNVDVQPVDAAPATPAPADSGVGGDPVSNLSLSDLITGKKPEDHGSTIVDMLKGAGNGVLASVDATGDLINQGLNKVGIPTQVLLGKDANNGVIQLATDEEAKAKGFVDPIFGKLGVSNDNIIPAPHTVAGQMTQGVSQFLTSMVGAGKLLAPIKVGGAVALAVKGAATGALADFAGFDPHADRLSNLIQQYPSLKNPINEYLASDPNDSDAEGRLKNALEGLGMGAITAPFIKAVGAIYRSVRAGADGGAEAGAKALQEAMPDVEAAVQKAHEADPQLDLFGEQPKPAEPGTAPAATAGTPTVANNRAAAGVDEARPVVDVKALSESLTRENLQYFDIAADPKLGSMFNFDKMDSGNAAHDAMKFVTPEVAKLVDKQVQAGTYSFGQMQADAAKQVGQMVDMGTEQLLGNVSKTFNDPKAAVSHLLAAKMVAQSLGREISNKITKIELGTATDQEKAFFVKNVSNLVDLQASLKVAQKTAARMTAAGRIATTDAVDTAGINAADILDAIQKGGDDGVRKLAAKLKRAEGDPQQILGMMKGGIARKTMDVVNEFYINSLLSGARTHLANITSNTFNLAYLPLEKMVSGAVTADTGPILEGVKIYKAYATSALTSIKMAAKSIRMGDNVLDPGVSKIDSKLPSNMTAAARGQYNDAARFAIHSTSDTALGSMIRGFGTTVRMPSRLLTGEDEFFKQIAFRSQLQADLEMKALRMFPKDKVAQANFVNTEFTKSFDATTGSAIVEAGSSAEKAMNFARETTFTQQLQPNSFGKFLQSGTAKFPLARTILPFVRTPVNIMRSVWTRTPGLNLLQKEFRDNLMAGGPRAQKAMGQMASGGMLYLGAMELANRGLLTGSGPADPNEKKKLTDTGWQPYSFQITGADGKPEYVSYQRMAPWATYLGLVSDLRDLAPHLTDGHLEELGTGMAIAMANNVTNQSFLQGITSFLDAVSEPGTNAKGKMLSFVRKTAAGFVPTGAMQLANLTGLGDDPYIREINSVKDAMMAKVPGLSKDLPMRYSWITGQPAKYPEGFVFPDAISPIPVKHNDGNVVLNELARLKHNFDPPAKTMGAIDLTPQQYARLNQLHGTVKVRGKTMMEALQQEMETPRYDIKRERMIDAPDQFSDYRTKRVQTIMGVYRDAAKKTLLDENAQPGGLKDQVRAQKQAQAKAYRGNMQDAQDFLDSLK